MELSDDDDIRIACRGRNWIDGIKLSWTFIIVL